MARTRVCVYRWSYGVEDEAPPRLRNDGPPSRSRNDASSTCERVKLLHKHTNLFESKVSTRMMRKCLDYPIKSQKTWREHLISSITANRKNDNGVM